MATSGAPLERRPLILNIDDDTAAVRLKTEVLRSAGFDVIEAMSGSAAVAIAAAKHPDLILLDVNLPDLDGFEVCARLKADPWTEPIPVVHITAAFPSSANWVRGLEAGAETYLVQPVDHDVLVATIRAVLRNRARESDQDRARRQLELEHRSLIEKAPFGIYRSTRDGRFLSANPALADILGYDSVDELLAVPLTAIYKDDRDRDRKLRIFDAHVAGRAETEWRRKDGGTVTVSLVGRAVVGKDSVPEAYEVFVEDVSRRRALEEQLRHAHKMEAIGQLAGGVAHDFNNLLTVVLGYTDMLLDQLGTSSPISDDLQQIKHAADRAASLTRQLLAFGRKQVLRMESVDVNQTVGEIDRMIARVLGDHIAVALKLTARPSRIRADVTQLGQVLMNLAVNARDAMPNGGTLTFETRNVNVGHGPVSTTRPMPAGAYVGVAVSDTGVGMDAHVVTRVFEPFFTTKDVGQGSGLGLATVYGIVQQLGGYIWVQSEPDRGTTFEMYFPEIRGDTDTATAETMDSDRGTSVGREVILLVEDEPGVRALTASALKRHGYHVLEASTSTEAIAQAQRFPSTIHLLLSDVMLPHLKGPDLARRLCADRPALRVLFMSGYSAETLMSAGTLTAGVDLVEKPFSPKRLLDHVRAILDAVDGRGL